MRQPITCLDDLTFYQFIDRQLPRKKLHQVEKHLGACPTCLQKLARLTRNSRVTMTPEEAAFLAAGPRADAREIFARMTPQTTVRLKPAKIRQPRPVLARHRLAFSFAAGLLGVLVVMLGSMGYRTWQSDNLARQGQASMIRYFYVNAGDPFRLSGGFKADLINTTRRSLPEEKADSLTDLFRKALAINANNTTAQQLAGQYELLKSRKYTEQAEAYLRQALVKKPGDAKLLNDIGVLYLFKKDSSTAADYFRQAFKVEPNCREALYNLALLHTMQNDSAKAEQAWQIFLASETDSTWRWAAQNRMGYIRE